MKKIVFVDDNKIALKLLEKTFVGSNHECYFFETSKAALEFCKSNRIDILCTDLSMPQLNGAELIAQVKLHQKNLKTVLLTAQADVECLMNILNSVKIDKVFIKPWSPIENGGKEEILELLNESEGNETENEAA